MSFWAGVVKGVEANDRQRQLDETRDERKAEREEAQAWREQQFKYQVKRDGIVDARNAAALEVAASERQYQRDKDEINLQYTAAENERKEEAHTISLRNSKIGIIRDRFEMIRLLNLDINPEDLGQGTSAYLGGGLGAPPPSATKPVSTQTGVEAIQSVTNQLNATMENGSGFFESLEEGSEEHTFWTTLMKDPNAVAAVEAFRISQNKAGDSNYINVADLPNIIKITNIVQAKGVEAREKFIDLVRNGGSTIEDDEAFWNGALAASQYQPLKVHWVQGNMPKTASAQASDMKSFEDTLSSYIQRISLDNAADPDVSNTIDNILSALNKHRSRGLQMAAEYPVVDPETGQLTTLAEQVAKDLGLSVTSTKGLVAYLPPPSTNKPVTPKAATPEVATIEGLGPDGNLLPADQLMLAVEQIPDIGTYQYINLGDGKGNRINPLYEGGTTTTTNLNTAPVNDITPAAAANNLTPDGKPVDEETSIDNSMVNVRQNVRKNPELEAAVLSALQGMSTNAGVNADSIRVIESLIEAHGEEAVELQMSRALGEKGLTIQDFRDHIYSSLTPAATGNTIPTPYDESKYEEPFFEEGRLDPLSGIVDDIDSKMADVDNARINKAGQESEEVNPEVVRLRDLHSADNPALNPLLEGDDMSAFDAALEQRSDLASTVVEAASAVIKGAKSTGNVIMGAVLRDQGFGALATSFEESGLTDQQIAQDLIRKAQPYDREAANSIAQPDNGFQQQTETGRAAPLREAATGETVYQNPRDADGEPFFEEGRLDPVIDIAGDIDSKMADVDNAQRKLNESLTELGETKVAEALSKVQVLSEEVIDVAVETLEDSIEGVYGNGKTVIAAVLRNQGLGALASAIEESELTDEQIAQTLIISANRRSRPGVALDENNIENNIMSDRKGLANAAENMFGGEVD